MMPVIKSYSEALHGFKFSIFRLTSLGEKGAIGCDICRGLSKKISMSLSESLEGSGVNTCSRCSANTSTFSLSLLAQLPPSFFKILNIDICGF